MVRSVGRQACSPALRRSTRIASAKRRGGAADRLRTLCESDPGHLAEEDRAFHIAARACFMDDEDASMLARLREVDGTMIHETHGPVVAGHAV